MDAARVALVTEAGPSPNHPNSPQAPAAPAVADGNHPGPTMAAGLAPPTEPSVVPSMSSTAAVDLAFFFDRGDKKNPARKQICRICR